MQKDDNNPLVHLNGSWLGPAVRAALNTAPFTGGVASLWSEWDSSRRFGFGTIGGHTHAFLITPIVPEPSSLTLLGFAACWRVGGAEIIDKP